MINIPTTIFDINDELNESLVLALIGAKSTKTKAILKLLNEIVSQSSRDELNAFIIGDKSFKVVWE